MAHVPFYDWLQLEGAKSGRSKSFPSSLKMIDAPPKFNIAPENGGWKTTFLYIGKVTFQGLS